MNTPLKLPWNFSGKEIGSPSGKLREIGWLFAFWLGDSEQNVDGGDNRQLLRGHSSAYIFLT
jgi:hypothetical protein